MGNPHPGRRPVTEADRTQVRTMIEAGMSRNAIARQLGRSGHTITGIARELGLTFDRANDPQLRAATDARIADGRRRRAQLQLVALDNANRLARQMFVPTTVFNFGGKDNTYNERQLDEPTTRDKRDLAVAIQALTNSAIRLAEHDSGAGLTGVVSLLDQLGRGLAAKYGDGDTEHPTDPESTEEP